MGANFMLGEMVLHLFNHWLNESQLEMNGNLLQISAPGKTDYFINPESGDVKNNAPFLYANVQGDFVLRAKVRHDFISTFDGAALFIMDSEREDCWAKLCYEYTDLNTYAVVSVVTNGVSDDANGQNLTDKSVWLQIGRKGDAFSMHYSTDGSHYHMVRVFNLKASNTLKVGLVSQSPTGEGLISDFSDVQLEQVTIENIRAGK
jgi:regulation of enolase protein 1 (concanavalin A-like superfamily)